MDEDVDGLVVDWNAFQSQQRGKSACLTAKPSRCNGVAANSNTRTAMKYITQLLLHPTRQTEFDFETFGRLQDDTNTNQHKQ